MPLEMNALQRTSRFHSVLEMVDLYKAQVLSFIEYRTPGIYHACDSHLLALNKIQTKYLNELGLSETDALLHFNLAPLSSRRDMAMLGLIHRTVLNKGPPHFKKFFYLEISSRQLPARSAQRIHHRRVHEHVDGRHLDVVKRSALGMANVYNMLPAGVVDAATVSSSQRSLQDILKKETAQNPDSWARLLSPRHMFHDHPLLHFRF